MINEYIEPVCHEVVSPWLPFVPSILTVLATSDGSRAVVGSYVTHEAKHFIYFYIGEGFQEYSCCDAATLTCEVLRCLALRDWQAINTRYTSLHTDMSIISIVTERQLGSAICYTQSVCIVWVMDWHREAYGECSDFHACLCYLRPCKFRLVTV